MTKPFKVYVCSVCEEEHDDYYEAEECCQPEVWTMYKCDSCGQVHEDEEDCLACCADTDEDGLPVEADPRLYPPLTDSFNSAAYIEKFIILNHYK